MKLTNKRIRTFWQKVDKSGECWLWTGYVNSRGVGEVSLPYNKGQPRRKTYPQRLAWMIEYGEDPGKKYVYRRCEEKLCVRPSHLYLGKEPEEVVLINNETDNLKFWQRVKIAGEDECWEWQGATNGKGYGMFAYNSKARLAHKVSYFIYYGYYSSEYLLHKCNNSMCVNPLHLRYGTSLENSRDMIDAKRSGATHLTDEQVMEIRHRRAQGEILLSIAKDYPVSYQSVHHAATGVTYSHLPLF